MEWRRLCSKLYSSSRQKCCCFKIIYTHLNENGRVCILLPCYDFPHEVIKGVAFSEKWQPHFKDFKEAQTFFPEDFYRNLLQNKGFKNLDIATVESNHPLTDEEF